MTIRVGSCFSGIAGFEKGLEQAGGFEVVWQIEVDPDAVSVLERHYPNTLRFRDVCDVDPEELPYVDLFVFGSPCQDLSVAGRRAGLAGERSGLFFEAIRLIKAKRPEWVIWENVPGALSSNEGQDFRAVLSAFEEIGYSVEGDILDARFHGVPQRRERIFLVCHNVDGPPKKTPYYANIGLQALGETLLSVLVEAGLQSSIAPTNWGFESKTSEDGRLKRMRLFGVTEARAFVRWLSCLEDGTMLSPSERDNLASHLDEGMVTDPIAMGTYGSLLKEATASYEENWNIEWSWSEWWEDHFSSRNESITSTPSRVTTDQRICSSALGLVSIAPYTLRLMRSFPNWFEEASWPLIASRGLTSYATQASNDLLADALGGSDFWRAVEQCAAIWYRETQRCLGDSGVRPAQVLFEPDSSPWDPAPSRTQRQGAARDAEGSTGILGFKESQSGTRESDVVGVQDANYGSRRHNGVMAPVAAEGGNRTSGEIDVSTALSAHGGTHGRLDFESETFIVDATNGGQGAGDPGTLTTEQAKGNRGQMVASPITASAGHHGHSSGRGDGADNLVVSDTVRSHPRPGSNSTGNIVPTEVQAFNWQAGGGGNDESFRGKSRQYPVRAGDYTGALSSTRHDAVAIPISSDAAAGRSGEAVTPSADAEGNVRLRPPSSGIGDEGDPSFTVNASAAPAVAIRTAHQGANGEGIATDQAHTLDGGPQQAVGFYPTGGTHGVSPTLDGGDAIKSGSGLDIASAPAIAFHQTQDPSSSDEVSPGVGRNGERGNGNLGVAISENQRAEVRETDYSRQITTGGGKPGQGYPSVRTGMTVRRLTPTECARLQGFPDDWARYRADGSVIPDGTQYRLLGNAVAVPVITWIGRRLRAVMEAGQ